MMSGKITLDVALYDDLKHGVIADPDGLVERLLDFLCNDPDDLFPEIFSVDGADWAQS